MSAETADLARRIANMVRVGRIAEVDHANVRVKVSFGNNTTRWVPWMTHRAGSTRNWHPPAVGEQVALLSPSGELGAGFVLPGGINWNDRAAPGNSGDVISEVSPDGRTESYNSASHEHTHTIPSGGKNLLTLGAATIEATNNHIKLTVGGSSIEVTAGGIHFLSNGQEMHMTGAGISVQGNITHEGNNTQTGTHTTTGDQIAGTVSQKNHLHTGVQTGPANTGKPVQ
jgi:phage baseplate assembly protein V